MLNTSMLNTSMLNSKNHFEAPGVWSERGATVALSGRILVVDDRDEVRCATSLLLSRLGLQVTTAESGRDALEIAILADKVDYGFHLILMKTQMPVMDGLEAAVLFRFAEYDGPIIAVSESSGDGIRAMCIDAGCDDVLLMPGDAGRVCEVLERHLRLAMAQETRVA